MQGAGCRDGAELLIVPNGSPYWIDKQDVRYGVAEARVKETGLPLAYVNQVGGQDELVFDGASFVLNDDASACRAAAGLGGGDRRHRVAARERALALPPGLIAEVEQGDAANYLACVTGLRDYVDKNGFPGVVLGLSGGIDSALCAAMAVDALGAGRVHCVMLPYRYTSNESLTDAAATRRGAAASATTSCRSTRRSKASSTSLEPVFAGTTPDATEENIQSRARGTLLMAISNKFGSMVLTTGNKSEMSVGYATLYGDMNGGFNPIKDLYKTRGLSRWRAGAMPRGPKAASGPTASSSRENVIDKAPTAELKPGQTDQDTLPPYDVLDDILNCLVEDELPVAGDRRARGHRPELVKRVERMLYLAEYKRRQAAPGRQDHHKPSASTGRYPITNSFREHRLLRLMQRRPSASRRRPTGPAFMLAMPGRRMLNWLFARRAGGQLSSALDDTDRSALDRGIRARHRGGSALARRRLGRQGAPVGPVRPLRRGGREAESERAALSRLRDAGGTRAQAQTPARPRQAAGL